MRPIFMGLFLISLWTAVAADSPTEVITADNLDRLALLDSFTFETPATGQNFIWLPDSSGFVVAADHQILLQQVSDQSETSQTLLETGNWVTHIALSADATRLAYGTHEGQGDGPFDEQEPAAQVIDLTSGKIIATFSLLRISRALGLNPDGTGLITVDALTYDISLWDVNRASLITTHSTNQPGYPWMLSAIFTADGTYLLLGSGGSDNTISIYDTATGDLLHDWYGNSDQLAVSQDGQSMVGASRYGGEAEVRALPSTEPITRLEYTSHWTLATALSPNSELAVTALDAIDTTDQITLWFWNANSGESLRRIPLTDELTTNIDLRFSPDGRFLLIADGTGVVAIWGIAET